MDHRGLGLRRGLHGLAKASGIQHLRHRVRWSHGPTIPLPYTRPLHIPGTSGPHPVPLVPPLPFRNFTFHPSARLTFHTVPVVPIHRWHWWTHLHHPGTGLSSTLPAGERSGTLLIDRIFLAPVTLTRVLQGTSLAL